MATQLQLRRGNTAQTAVFTGALAEVTVDTDKKTIIVHDGVTPGGYALALQSVSSAGAQSAYDRANSSFDQANLAFNKANSANSLAQSSFDEANTKYSSSGGTISGNVIVTGNVTPTTDNVYSLGSASYRWKDIFVGAGTVDIDGLKLSKINGQLVISGATDLVLSGTNLPSSTNTANNIANAFNQANLAFGAANTAVTDGQANTGAALIAATSYTDTANTNLKNYTDSTFLKLSSPAQTVTGNLILNGYVTIQNDLTISGNVTTINTIELNVADNEVVLNSDWDSSQIPTQNAGITINRGLYTNTFIRYDENNDYWVLRDNVEQYIIATTANAGAGDIAVTTAYQANVGALRIDFNTANSSLAANIGAARIADSSSSQANVGAGLISVTLAYEANVGAARIADAVASQANVGVGLITVTSAYEANVGQLRIDTNTANSSLAANIGAARIADAAASQANVGEAKIISLERADSAFEQANLAFNKANSANVLAQDAYDAANSAGSQSQANVGAGLISVTLAYEANVGAARIADVAAGQANVGAGLISVTSAYEANVGALRINTETANSSLAANIGAARIADSAAAQANVGAGLISVTTAYEANVGAAKIIALGRADSAFAQANLAYDAANNVAPQIQPTRNVANSAFAQANLAYDTANSKLSSSGGTISGDLVVTGNLTISGNTTTLNVSSLKVTDPIIQLATDNQTDLVDIGFVGHYANTPNNHTGLIRKYTDGKYYLFDSYTPGTEPTNLIDIANTRVATLSANLTTDVITLRGLDPLDYANTIQTAAQANVGAGLISVTNAYQANVGALRIDTNTANSVLAANIGAARIADAATSQANVGAGLITVTSAYQANVGAGLLTKVAKSGDTISGVLTVTGGDGTYSSLELNGYNQRGGSGYHGFLKANNTSAASGAKHFRINSAGALEIVNSGYTATIFAVSDTGDLSSVKSIRLYESFVGSGSLTTSTTSQVTLDSFATTSYRSGKYLVQMTSGSAYHMIELSLIHDGTTVYLSQYGEVKTGASLGTFDASISTGTLSLLFTPTNAITTAKFFATLMPV